MSFESTRRHGRFWDDALKLNKMIRKYPFNTTNKSEREFETGFAHTLMHNKRDFNCQVITQISKSGSVGSVYCFGKKHRPDMTLDENGIAIELKYITYSGLRDAIGQGYIYRLKYRFVFLLLIVSESKKTVYEDLSTNKEKDLRTVLQHLADEMNIFTYIVPAFNIKSDKKIKGYHAFFRK